MIVLGVRNAHDASVAVVKDGKLLFALEEERPTRVKHIDAFPINALNEAFRFLGIGIDDVDIVTVSEGSRPAQARQNYAYLKRMGLHQFASQQLMASLHPQAGLWLKCHLEGQGMSKGDYEIRSYDHHLSHAAASYCTSGFDDALVMTSDAVGSIRTTGLVCQGQMDTLVESKRYYMPDSLGGLYGVATGVCGFGMNQDGTTMALAPYGKPVFANMTSSFIDFYAKAYEDVLRRYSRGEFHAPPAVDPITQLAGEPRRHAMFLRSLNPRFIASSAQEYLERRVFERLRESKIDRDTNLCLGGGTFLNCVLNAKLLERAKDVFIFPAANDAGLSVGSAALAWGKRLPRLENAYLGPEPSCDEIEESIEELPGKWRANLEVTDADPRYAVELLASGSIVGRFAGRMEFGPRALGNRSILATPSSIEVKKRLNFSVKHREEFRPYAPSVLAEHADDWFEDMHKSPFMLLAFKVKPERMDDCIGIVHYDRTARVQTVEDRENPDYYRLIEEYRKLTGVPMLLNTSFNRRGETMVYSPAQALDMFVRTGMDALILGKKLLVKDGKRVQNADCRMQSTEREPGFRTSHSALCTSRRAYNRLLFDSDNLRILKRTLVAGQKALQAQKIMPRSPWPHVCLGDVAAVSRDPKGAIRFYRKALDVDPDNDRAVEGLARELGHSMGKGPAVKQVVQAIHRRMAARIWLTLAKLYEAAGRRRDSKRCIDRFEDAGFNRK